MAKTMDLARGVQLLLFVIGVIALSMAAEKFKEVCWRRSCIKKLKFIYLNCLIWVLEVLLVLPKKVPNSMYTTYETHVENLRLQAIEQVLAEASKEGLGPREAGELEKWLQNLPLLKPNESL